MVTLKNGLETFWLSAKNFLTILSDLFYNFLKFNCNMFLYLFACSHSSITKQYCRQHLLYHFKNILVNIIILIGPYKCFWFLFTVYHTSVEVVLIRLITFFFCATVIEWLLVLVWYLLSLCRIIRIKWGLYMVLQLNIFYEFGI